MSGIFKHSPVSFFILEAFYWIITGSLGFLTVGYWQLGEWGYVMTLGFGFLAMIYSGFIEPRRLVVVRKKIRQKNLPKLRLALLSDFHIGPLKGELWMKKVVKRLEKENFDVLLMPGDFLEGSAEKYADFLAPLQAIKQPKYATLGNHDHMMNFRVNKKRAERLRKKLKAFGIEELKNSAIFLKKQGIWLAGVDDNSFSHCDDLPQALKNVKDLSKTVFIAHSPDIAYKIGKYPLALTVCGHTHGGQIRLPWLGAVPFLIPSVSGKRYEKGWYPTDNIYVTSGLGESSLRMRSFNPPEIVILEIN